MQLESRVALGGGGSSVLKGTLNRESSAQATRSRSEHAISSFVLIGPVYSPKKSGGWGPPRIFETRPSQKSYVAPTVKACTLPPKKHTPFSSWQSVVMPWPLAPRS
jgi:hypothetical protein